MREIQAYLCYDGSLFADEEKAKAHDDDLLGQELEGLLRLFEFGGDVTRSREWRALITIMKKRKELAQTLGKILTILNHDEG